LCGELEEINQIQIKERLQTQVTNFFQLLRNKIDLLETKVSRKIEESSNLHSLISALDDMHSHMTENEVADKYSAEKVRLDDKLGEGRFTFVSRRKDDYNVVIERMNGDNTKL
jgi:hypothetical protein